MQDVIVVGGSYAGLSATLQLARARRRVRVIDAGVRRNRFAAHAHGFLGQDGKDPAAIAELGKREVLAYPTVQWVNGTAAHAEKVGDGFAVTLASGERHEARRLVLAAGVVDDLPEIPGVAERWGRSVFHCPYCHGYELGGRDIGVLATSPMAVHVALMLPDWGKTTYFTRGLFEPTDEERAALHRRGVTVETGAVVAVEGNTPEVVVRLAGDRTVVVAGIFVGPKTRIATSIPAELGCELDDGPMGPFLRLDPMMRETTVRGVFACGDMALPAGSVALAVADGVRAGVGAHQSLIFRS